MNKKKRYFIAMCIFIILLILFYFFKEDRIQKKVDSMTIEEKIGQIVLPSFRKKRWK